MNQENTKNNQVYYITNKTIAMHCRFDNDLDKDGDNILNKEEIIAWIIPSNEEIANEEVTHLFAGSDEDMDGLLSFEEVINNYDLFVGSEVRISREFLEKHKISFPGYRLWRPSHKSSSFRRRAVVWRTKEGLSNCQ